MDGKKISVKCPECGTEFVLDAVYAENGDETAKAVGLAVAEAKAESAAELASLRKELQRRDEDIAFLRDMRSRLSTKMVGESLEKHCEAEFMRVRSAAFPRAEFGKDNNARSGSKGDYIFRECDKDGTEILSIMFEMKNEAGGTSRKNRNDAFFKELDKDRREKGCEYAVLVTTLEPDSEFYNAGIADVSYAYPKMLVVRPQCFLTVISILRNAAMDALSYKQELAAEKSRHADLDGLNSRIEAFRNAFLAASSSTGQHIANAADEIDKIIVRLEKLRDELSRGGRQLSRAAVLADGLSVQKPEEDVSNGNT